MIVTFERVELERDGVAVIQFLTDHEWPFHSVPRLSAEQAMFVDVISDTTDSYWVCSDGSRVGLVRLLDLDDLDDGGPLFDLRIEPSHRGRGLGTIAVTWLTSHLFEVYPTLHRIEATTRDDNLAMQRVFDRCDYQLEGRMREAWRNDDGTRHDALAYAILRSEWGRQER